MATLPGKQDVESAHLQTFEFTLIVSGISEINDDVESAVYRVCDDALLGMQHGKVFLDFARESDSMISAIVSAIRDVEGAGIAGLQVSEVRPPSMSPIEVVNTLLESRHSIEPSVFADELARLIPKLRNSEP